MNWRHLKVKHKWNQWDVTDLKGLHVALVIFLYRTLIVQKKSPRRLMLL